MKEYYGIIGNGETCALISPLGSIDWLCLPAFDGDLVFANALDPVNGESLTLHYFEQKRELAFQNARQQYVPRTNILQSVLEYHGLTITITDLMPWTYRGGEHAIVRKVAIKNTGKHVRTIEVVAKTKKPSGKDADHRELQNGDIIAHTDRYALGIVFKETKLRVKAGEEKSLCIILCYEKFEKLKDLMENWRHRQIDEVVRSTTDFWNNWLDRGRPIEVQGDDRDAVERGLLCMKLLQYAPTGAFVAAPTASFPAYPGLNDNWDYRFCWIRDTYFACRAMLLAGHFDEVQSALQFLLSLQTDGHWQQPFYTINGTLPPKEEVVETLRGPNHELNIRLNNGARDQLQLDSEGSVLHLLYLYLLFSKDQEFIGKHRDAIVKIADWITANYGKSENGIWEFRDRRLHWTYGKVLCYAGLESANKISDILRMQKRWDAEKIRSEVLKESWSDQRNAFLQTYEDDAPLDISVLAIENYGLLPADAQKMVRTVKSMEQKMVFNGGVRRYEAAVLPFFLATFWLAGHYIRAHERKKARALIDNALSNMTTLRLAAEHYDPRSGSQHGNFPQLFCMSMCVEQIISYYHSSFLIENLSILSLPVKKTAELVDELLVSPLKRLFD